MPPMTRLLFDSSADVSMLSAQHTAVPSTSFARPPHPVSDRLVVTVAHDKSSLQSKLQAGLRGLPLGALPSDLKVTVHAHRKLFELTQYASLGPQSRSLTDGLGLSKTQLRIVAAAFLGGGPEGLIDVEFKTQKASALKKWGKLPREEVSEFARKSQANAALVSLFEGLAAHTHKIAQGASRDALPSLFTALLHRGLPGVTDALAVLASDKDFSLHAVAGSSKRRRVEPNFDANAASPASKRQRRQKGAVLPFLRRNLSAPKGAVAVAPRMSLERLSHRAFTMAINQALCPPQSSDTAAPPSSRAQSTAFSLPLPAAGHRSSGRSTPLGAEELAHTLLLVRQALEHADGQSAPEMRQATAAQQNTQQREENAKMMRPNTQTRTSSDPA